MESLQRFFFWPCLPQNPKKPTFREAAAQKLKGELSSDSREVLKVGTLPSLQLAAWWLVVGMTEIYPWKWSVGDGDHKWNSFTYLEDKLLLITLSPIIIWSNYSDLTRPHPKR